MAVGGLLCRIRYEIVRRKLGLTLTMDEAWPKLTNRFGKTLARPYLSKKRTASAHRETAVSASGKARCAGPPPLFAGYKNRTVAPLALFPASFLFTQPNNALLATLRSECTSNSALLPGPFFPISSPGSDTPQLRFVHRAGSPDRPL